MTRRPDDEWYGPDHDEAGRWDWLTRATWPALVVLIVAGAWLIWGVI